jgi:Icc-related predicted phosphoesterase
VGEEGRAGLGGPAGTGARRDERRLLCFFASDLHGHEDRYEKLCAAARAERPAAIFLVGDLTDSRPSARAPGKAAPIGYVARVLGPRFEALRKEMGAAYPDLFLILGNDDPRTEEAAVLEAEGRGLWSYAHMRRIPWRGYDVFGYACVPPTPFRLKDWERYDVSRAVEPGCVPPEEGVRTVPVPGDEVRFGTIAADLGRLAGATDLSQSIFLLHSPPYRTDLDRAALDDHQVEGVPLDVHIGSIAIERFLRARQPLLSLHGHVHESARLTGAWRARIEATHALSAAHDGPELALVRFDPADPAAATRELL